MSTSPQNEELPVWFDPDTMIAVHHYREVGDADDTASLARALVDCGPGAPNAGKELCFIAQAGQGFKGDFLLDPYPAVRMIP